MFLDQCLNGGKSWSSVYFDVFCVGVFFFFTLDLNLALQKLLVENRADLPLLFWWAFYGTINA